MANVANTKATGPVSKGAHSGGKTFTPKLTKRGGDLGNFTNGSSDAERKIKGLKYSSAPGKWGQDPSKVLNKKPS